MTRQTVDGHDAPHTPVRGHAKDVTARPARPAKLRPRPTWTDDRLARLQALWARGLANAEIAMHLGVSASAIADRLSRLGLSRAALRADTTPQARAVEANPAQRRSGAYQVTTIDAGPIVRRIYRQPR